MLQGLTVALVLVAAFARPSATHVVGPRAVTSASATYRFSAHERGVAPTKLRFRCALDSTKLDACNRRLTIPLAAGMHVLRVVAVDPSGRSGPVTRVRIVANPIAKAASFPVGSGPVYIDAGAGSLWVSDLAGIVSRVDPATGAVTAKITIGGQLAGVSYGDGAVWVGSFDGDFIARIDPSTNAVTKIHLGGNPFHAGFAPDGTVWVSNFDGSIERLDPTAYTATQRITTGGQGELTAVGFSRVWSTNEDGSVHVIDPAADKEVAAIQVARDVDGISLSPDAVYVSTFYDGTVVRIDPATLAVAARTTIPGQAGGVLFAAGSLWVSDYKSALLYRLDPQSLKVQQKIRVGAKARQSVFAGGSVWTVNQETSTLSRYTP